MTNLHSALPIYANRTAGVRRLVVLPAVLLALTLTGCGLSPTCSETNQPYLSARAVPALKVPAGMDAPTHAGALNAPSATDAQPQTPAAAAAVSARSSGKCLDEAPSYFGTAISPLSLPEEIVAVWAEAWNERNTDRMMAAYSPNFAAPEGMAKEAWLEQRREQVATGPVPSPGVQGLKMTQPAPDRRVATFTQRFENNTIRRELTFDRESNFWRIVGERVLEVE
ncbi:MAG: hypothetical protein ABL964_02100 [Steroidobacteraceae bacterium]